MNYLITFTILLFGIEGYTFSQQGAASNLGVESMRSGSNQGDFNQSIPVVVPKERNNLDPKLAIGYSSFSGNTALGLGWSLSLPKISRSKTSFSKYYHSTIGYVSQTESGIFLPKVLKQIIKFVFDETSDSWIVYRSNGVREVYSSLDYKSDDNLKTNNWYLVAIYSPECKSKIRDCSPDVKYEYKVGRFETLIKKISYNYVGLDNLSEVLFTYTDRPDVTTRYFNGSQRKLKSLLASVQVINNKQQVRKYDLDYNEPSGLVKFSTVKSIRSYINNKLDVQEEYSYSGMKSVLGDDQSVTEIYDTPISSIVNGNGTLLDVDGDGLLDVYFKGQGVSEVYYLNDYRYHESNYSMKFERLKKLENFKSPSTAVSKVYFMDIDGDGYVDQVPSDGSKYYSKRLKGGSYKTIKEIDMYSITPGQSFVLDMNSDGLHDYFYYRSVNEVHCVTNQGKLKFKKNVIKDFFIDHTITPSNPRVKTGDFNGDGLLDIGKFLNDRLLIHLNNGQCNFEKPLELVYKENPQLLNLSLLDGEYVKFIRTQDINDDGFYDIITQVEQGETVILFGDTDLKFSSSIVIPDFNRTTELYIYDYDGDGTKEIVECPINKLYCNIRNLFPKLKPGLMLGSKSSKGRIINVKYESSAKYNQDRDDKKWMPLILPILSEISIKDGVLADKMIQFDYKSGYYDLTSGRFMGFSYFTEIHPPSGSYYSENKNFVPARTLRTRYNTGILYNDDLLGVASSGIIISQDKPDNSMYMQYDLYERDGELAKLTLKQVISGFKAEGKNNLTLKKTYFNNLVLPVKEEVFINAEAKWSHQAIEQNGELYKVTEIDFKQFGSFDEMVDEKFYFYKVSEVVKASDSTILSSNKSTYKEIDGRVKLTQTSEQINEKQSIVTNFKYNGYFPLLKSESIDASGNVLESIEYDDWGIHMTKVINALGHVKKYNYDLSSGLLSSMVDENNNKTEYTYDEKNRVKTTKVLNGQQLIGYKEHEYIEHSSTSPQIDTELTWLDAKGNSKNVKVSFKTIDEKLMAELVSGPEGSIVLNKGYIYNDDYLEAHSLNAPVITGCQSFYRCDFNQIIVESPHKIKFFDAALRVESIYWPLEDSFEQFTFSNESNKNTVEFTDKLGHKIATYKDVFGNVIGKGYSSQEGEQIYSYLYDPMNRLISLVMPSGQTRNYSLNYKGSITSFTEDGKNIFTSSYNDKGYLFQKKWQDGQVETISYNLLNLPEVVEFNDSDGSTITNKYIYGDDLLENNVGKLIGTEHQSGRNNIYYNELGLPSTIDKLFFEGDKKITINHDYDFTGKLVKKDINGSLPIEFKYDEQGWLSSIPGYVSSIVWDSPQALSEFSLPGDVKVKQKFHSAFSTLEQIEINTQNLNSKYKYEYDKVGNIIKRSQSNGADIDYVYNQDITYKLNKYTYDNKVLNYNFDIDNGLIHKDQMVRTESGQMKKFMDKEFAFGPNRRLSLVNKGGQKHWVSYNSSNIPAVEKSKNLTIHHIDENYSLVNGELQLRVLLLNKIVAEVQSNKTDLIVTDYINTPLEYFNEHGVRTNKITMDSFGNYLEVLDKGKLSQYTTGMAGLYYNSASETYSMGTRFYNPKAGEFVRMDQLAVNEPGKFLDNQIELNLFQYARNNPANYTDPTGENTVFLGGAGNESETRGYGLEISQKMNQVGMPYATYVPNSTLFGQASNLFFALAMRESPLHSKSTLFNSVLSPIMTASNNLGNQRNIVGYSYGSVTGAQAALRMANNGIVVDNLILVGSPISSSSELFKSLSRNNNIHNIQRIDISHDPFSNGIDMKTLWNHGMDSHFKYMDNNMGQQDELVNSFSF